MTKYNELSEKNGEGMQIFKALLLGCAVGAAVCAVLLSLTAMGLVKAGTLPVEALPVITTAIGAVGSFFAGYFTVKVYKKRGLLLGFIAGVLLFVIIFIIGLSNGTDKNLVNALAKCVIFAVSGSIGGVVRVNKKAKVRKY